VNPKIAKLLPVIVLGALGAIAWIILSNPPESSFRGQSIGPTMVVETQTIAPTNFQVNVPSYGMVRPRIQSLLVAQVSGQIVDKSPNFDEGGYFAEGEVMLMIDPRDYEANVMIAEASLADAQQSLAEEEARAEQAQVDWNRLGNEGEASDLVLRKPQLAAAKARVASAEANLIKARLDLERTQIRAPFDGRVLRQIVDLGQVVGNNSQLAEFYSVGIAEVRLPIANKDLDFVDLPEFGIGRDAASINATLYSELASTDTWDARVVRTEAAIDDTARQLHVLVHVDNPFTADEQHRVPLKIGQYVTASIEGRLLEDVIVIPSSTVYQGSYVYVVEDGTLQRRELEIQWSDVDQAIVAAGLEPGDELVTTLLGQVTSGTAVSIAGQEAAGQAANVPGRPPEN
jgi:RND family efflux transporter MFP subunit